MRSVSQKDNLGCGIACIAFILKRDYLEISSVLGRFKANNEGFNCKELSEILYKFGFVYSYKYLRPHLKRGIYKNGVIVFVKRSKKYPSGHYLVRWNNLWMDPWINFLQNKKISEAKSCFRRRLPGMPIYGIFPSTERPV